jgi:hypothetical protein
VASFTQLPSGNWRVQVRRKNRYVSETFRRRKDGEDWALDVERKYRLQRITKAQCRCPSQNLRRYYRSAHRRHVNQDHARVLLTGAVEH